MNLLGSHLSLKSPSFFLGTVEKALENKETCFMFYTGAPQNTLRRPLSELRIEEGKAKWLSTGYSLSSLVVHAPYLLNLASESKEGNLEFSREFLKEELKRTSAFGASILVLHPGYCLTKSRGEAISTLVESLDEVLSQDGTNVRIALETMALSKGQLGSLDDLKEVISQVKTPDRVGVCLDTCHLFAAGYPAQEEKKMLALFDSHFPREKLLAIHLNDSKEEFLSHKDRHENLGYGKLGFEALKQYASDPALLDVPKILETPFFQEKDPHAKEIALLRKGVYEPSWRDSL